MVRFKPVIFSEYFLSNKYINFSLNLIYIRQYPYKSIESC